MLNSENRRVRSTNEPQRRHKTLTFVAIEATAAIFAKRDGHLAAGVIIPRDALVLHHPVIGSGVLLDKHGKQPS